ncbi:MAG: TolC family protein, partial [Winogradskyella sp.]|nr:TolC family protein [Winogradskyella sp.]
MKHTNLFCIIALLAVSVVGAQVVTTSDAIALALENNYGIKIANNNVEVAENNKNVLNSGFLPTLTGNAGATFNRDNI